MTTMKTKNVLLVGGTAAMAVAALAFARPDAGKVFAGSDDQAREAVAAIDPGYEPWFSPLWEPPSGEVASLLFALQSALGAGAVCYALGYWRGRRKKEDGDA